MHQTKTISRQSGTVLVFSLLILLIMTVIGVTVMSSTQMQERMAGNATLQTQAFEAASAGISQALWYGMNQFFGDPETDSDFSPRCTIEALENGDWTDHVQPSFTTLTTLPESAQTAAVEYRLRAECFRDPGLVEITNAEGYVTSEGRVSVNGEVLARREVEVRVDDFRTDGRSAMRIEGGTESTATITFDAANSKEFVVDGVGGPAITSSTLANAEEITRQIGEERLGNYSGGVSRSEFGPPFNSAWKMARFALEIRAFLEYNGYVGGHTVADGDACDLDELEAEEPELDLPRMGYFPGNFQAQGGTTFDGITYVGGNFSMGGNPRGNGILIVEGRVGWRGTAEAQGVVIGLGGRFEMDGGGQGDTNGMIYIADVDIAAMQGAYDNLLNDWDEIVAGTGKTDYDCWAECTAPADIPISDPVLGQPWEAILARMDAWGNPDEEDITDTEYDALRSSARPDGFGDTFVAFNGGGNHTVTYDCKSADEQRRLLSACGKHPDEPNFLGDPDPVENNGFVYDGLADPWADQLCNTPGAGGSIQAIRSWRENLGWRELLTGT